MEMQCLLLIRYSGFLKRPEILETVYSVEEEEEVQYEVAEDKVVED